AGAGIGRSLAAPPGPVNAIRASQTVTRSWREGFLVGMGATTADTIFLAVSVAAHSAVASIQGWVPFVALLGAGVMAYFAWNTVRALRRGRHRGIRAGGAREILCDRLEREHHEPLSDPLVAHRRPGPDRPARSGGPDRVLFGTSPVDLALPARPARGPTPHCAHVPGGPRVLDCVPRRLLRLARVVRGCRPPLKPTSRDAGAPSPGSRA